MCLDVIGWNGNKKTAFYLFPPSEIILFLSVGVRSQLCNLQLRRSFVKSEKVSPDDDGIIRVWTWKVKLLHIQLVPLKTGTQSLNDGIK